MSENAGRRGGGARRAGEPSVAEWMVASLGLVLVLGSLGFLLFRAATADDSPVEIAIRVEEVSETRRGFRVTVAVRNLGDRAVAELGLEGRLTDAGEEVETSEATLDYLPAHSSRKAGLFFQRNPATLTLELRPKGFREP